MYIELDPALLEDVVFLAMRCREQLGDQAMFRDYRNRVDAAYDAPDDDRNREIAFRDVHADFFRELGFEQMLRDCLEEFPVLVRELDRASFLKAISRKEEGGELFVRKNEEDGSGPQRTAVVRLGAEVFLDSSELLTLLRREFCHISDMVDPAFGYQPALGETGDSIAQENLIRDRYRALWSVFVEARLVRAGQATDVTLQKRQRLLKRAFGGLADQDADTIIRKASDTTTLTHTDLLALARN